MVNGHWSIGSLIESAAVKELIVILPPQPAGCVTGMVLLLLLSKNMLCILLKPDCIGTEPKEVPNPVTGGSGRLLMKPSYK
jgi:hypothetical protein